MYFVYKKVGNRQYAYLQRSYRVGNKVRTESIYLGASDGSKAEWKRIQPLLVEKNNRENDIFRMRHKAELREAMYKAGHPSPQFKAARDQAARKEAAHKEAREAKYQKPTPEDEAALAERVERWQEEHARASAEYAEQTQPAAQSPDDGDESAS